MTGAQLLRILRRLPREELDLDAETLLHLYDQPTCTDCGNHHATIWAAIACDELTDARRRRRAAHSIRESRIETRPRQP